MFCCDRPHQRIGRTSKASHWRDVAEIHLPALASGVVAGTETVESFHGEDRISSENSPVQIGMLDEHLPDVGARSLGSGIREVGQEVIEAGSDRWKLRTEAVPDGLCRCIHAAGVVVEQDEGDVVPVLGLASGVRRRTLRQ